MFTKIISFNLTIAILWVMVRCPVLQMKKLPRVTEKEMAELRFKSTSPDSRDPAVSSHANVV